MVKLINILVLASGICATAFSLERARLNSNAKVSSNTIRKSATPQVHGTSTLLKSADSSSASSSDIVAKAKAPATFIDSIWNENTKLSFYLLVWYAGNILYNIYNKKACNALGKNSHGGSNLHWALSAVQLLVGVIAVIPLWLSGIRKAPKLTLDNWKELAPVGLFTSLAHAFSVLALGAGAVSFGQIVKAGEPVFAAATNAVLLGVRKHIFSCDRNHHLCDTRTIAFVSITIGHRSSISVCFPHPNYRRCWSSFPEGAVFHLDLLDRSLLC